jgi:Tfp pilus assembly protein PilV
MGESLNMKMERLQMKTREIKAKKNRWGCPKGFTLVEVLIGLLFLSLGLLAMAGLHLTAILGNFNSKNLTQATYALQDRLEILESVDFDSVALNPGEHNDGPVTISGVMLNRTYAVVANGNLKTIQYRVAWNDGSSRSISFSTVRSQ